MRAGDPNHPCVGARIIGAGPSPCGMPGPTLSLPLPHRRRAALPLHDQEPGAAYLRWGTGKGKGRGRESVPNHDQEPGTLSPPGGP